MKTKKMSGYALGWTGSYGTISSRRARFTIVQRHKYFGNSCASTYTRALLPPLSELADKNPEETKNDIDEPVQK